MRLLHRWRLEAWTLWQASAPTAGDRAPAVFNGLTTRRVFFQCFSLSFREKRYDDIFWAIYVSDFCAGNIFVNHQSFARSRSVTKRLLCKTTWNINHPLRTFQSPQISTIPFGWCEVDPFGCHPQKANGVLCWEVLFTPPDSQICVSLHNEKQWFRLGVFNVNWGKGSRISPVYH